VPDLKKGIAFLYMEGTKFDPEAIHRGARPNILPAERFKRYPASEKVILPRRWEGEIGGFLEVLQRRRSHRNYTGGLIGRDDLSLLLWSSQGVTAQAGPCYLRTAPSAGALYPIETYVLVERVEGVQKGIYHFDVRGFQLERLKEGPVLGGVARMALGQGFLKSASVLFAWSAVPRRTMERYGNRGLRYIFMEAGHVCQNLLLAAEALELGACPVAAFFDNEFNALLGLDGEEETVIYLAAIGRKQGT